MRFQILSLYLLSFVTLGTSQQLRNKEVIRNDTPAEVAAVNVKYDALIEDARAVMNACMAATTDNEVKVDCLKDFLQDASNLEISRSFEHNFPSDENKAAKERSNSYRDSYFNLVFGEDFDA